jgi:DeoR family transcriptional regulator of aga operon
MIRSERLSAILGMLANSGRIEIDELVQKLGASPATVRRDLDVLAGQQLLSRTHGGAIAHSVAYDLPIRYKYKQRPDAKTAIARKAAEMVPRGAVVGLSGGTTTTAIADALMSRADIMAPAPDPGLTIVTNAINIAMQSAMRSQIKTVLTGGVANFQSYEFVGSFAEEVLKNVTLDLAFLVVNGMDSKAGPTSHDEREAAVNRMMAQCAARVVVVTDSSKLGKKAFASLGPIQLINMVITDEGATKEQIAGLRDHGYEVVVAQL